MTMRSGGLTDTVGFNLLGDALAQDIEKSIQAALDAGAVFAGASDPLSIFRESLAESIRTIESDNRIGLFQRFLKDGPYTDSGAIPVDVASAYLSDNETAAAIRFIYFRVINYFQGCLAELLAVAPCVLLLERLQNQGTLPPDAKLYVGDAIAAGNLRKPGLAKGADIHILVTDRTQKGIASAMVAGVVEIKSYLPKPKDVLSQSTKHLQRAGIRLRIGIEVLDAEQIRVGCEGKGSPIIVTVVPSSWALPRIFHFEGESLIVDPTDPPSAEARIVPQGDNEWQIILRWSHEALAEAAYEMTFWYMGKIGEIIYAEIPHEWAGMTPWEAGRNAIKMMLYYAILRCRTKYENERAVALYNTYGFGYALGMNFKKENGSREMLWPEDLNEILVSGKNKYGCTIAK